jgi:hypothetical protein
MLRAERGKYRDTQPLSINPEPSRSAYVSNDCDERSSIAKANAPTASSPIAAKMARTAKAMILTVANQVV